MNSFCFAYMYLGSITLPLHKGKWVQLNGKTLLHKFLCQKGLQCHICQKSYSSDANLKDHIKNVHQNEQYPCENCGKIFKSKTYLKSHLKLAHLDTTQHFRQERKTLLPEKLYIWFFSMQEDEYFCYWICDFHLPIM